MPPQQQQQEWGHRESFNLAVAGINALCTAVTVFTRHSFGREGLG